MQCSGAEGLRNAAILANSYCRGRAKEYNIENGQTKCSWETFGEKTRHYLGCYVIVETVVLEREPHLLPGFGEE